jgi:molybdenum cofactor sulfurtransferase
MPKFRPTLSTLQGGTVSSVQTPGSGHGSFTFTGDEIERFEDGTLNFLGIAAIREGLAFLSRFRPSAALRVSILSHWLFTQLQRLEYDSGERMVYLVSTQPQPCSRANETMSAGSTVSFVMLKRNGRPIRNDTVEAAARSRVALVSPQGHRCKVRSLIPFLRASGLAACATQGL